MKIIRFALTAGILFMFQTLEAKVCADSLKLLSIFPNPTAGTFNLSVQAPHAGDVTIKVLNLQGVEIAVSVKALSAGSNNVPVDLSAQPNGIYFATASMDNISSNALKLVLLKKTAERGDSLDIIHYDLNLNIRNLASKSIDGFALIKLLPKVDSITIVKFDLLKLNVSNVSVNNIALPFSQNDSELFVTLNMHKPALPDSTFDLKVEYGGQPVLDGTWGGFYFSGNYAYNLGVGFRSNPHNFGRCWFPCFDNFTDRATYSFHITTDATFMGVCNGLKQPETLNGDGSTTWHWTLNQPIPTYLASVAVGKYALIKNEFTGQNGTYPVWIAVEAQDSIKAKASFAKLNNALLCFEEKFGAYPFDRVGYVGVPFNSGAMEHAGNIAYPLYAIDGTTNYETLFAHELSHMWWGDKATCRTAEDMWLNEGWASFCEALFLECVYGKDFYINEMKSKVIEGIKDAAPADGGFYPVSGIPANITYGNHVYKKGALMVNTLRTIMGDVAFFAACKSYLSKHMFKDVSSEDLRAEFQQFTSADLTNFFNVWIYEKGHVDVVATGVYPDMDFTSGRIFLRLQQLQRYKSAVSTGLPVTVKAYDQRGKSASFTLVMKEGTLDTLLNHGGQLQHTQYITINEDVTLGLGKTMVKQTIKNTGISNFNDVLTSINVQQITDSAVLVLEHHWTGPLQGNIRTKGIRISQERYWHVDGMLPSTFKSWAFFNYNGTANAFLDQELINKTEDSLVLLYRPEPLADWQIVTDLTHQAGSKTDKTGRFWINELKKGDYAFGMRDISVVGVKENEPGKIKHSFTIIPNPATNAQSVILQFDEPTFIDTITVIDQSGKQLASVAVHRSLGQYELDTAKLKQGHYIIMISGPQGPESKIFVK
jgi:hypothetical protein